ncbi:MAG: ATP-binding cassette domain-containing protein [Clostridia bacterium]
MISIQNLSKANESNTVFKEISVELLRGTVYGLVGVNGCGKSTLMRCICGFTRPSSGTVTVMGKLIGKDVDFAPSTGVIIDTPGFLSHDSCRKNLEILAGISGKADKARIDEVIRMVGLDPTDKKPVGKYSLGMRQRLGIAQAIMEDPDQLILDEPFNGLDKQGIADIHDLLQQWKSHGKTILLASHSTADIAQACDIVYELQDGHLVEQPTLSASQVG